MGRPTTAATATDDGTELTITIDKGNKQWVAVIDGTGSQYGYDRAFISPYGQGTATETVADGTVIETCWHSHSGREKGRTYHVVVAGDLCEIDADDVERALTARVVRIDADSVADADAGGSEGPWAGAVAARMADRDDTADPMTADDWDALREGVEDGTHTNPVGDEDENENAEVATDGGEADPDYDDRLGTSISEDVAEYVPDDARPVDIDDARSVAAMYLTDDRRYSTSIHCTRCFCDVVVSERPAGESYCPNCEGDGDGDEDENENAEVATDGGEDLPDEPEPIAFETKRGADVRVRADADPSSVHGPLAIDIYDHDMDVTGARGDLDYRRKTHVINAGHQTTTDGETIEVLIPVAEHKTTIEDAIEASEARYKAKKEAKRERREAKKEEQLERERNRPLELIVHEVRDDLKTPDATYQRTRKVLKWNNREATWDDDRETMDALEHILGRVEVGRTAGFAVDDDGPLGDADHGETFAPDEVAARLDGIEDAKAEIENERDQEQREERDEDGIENEDENAEGVTDGGEDLTATETVAGHYTESNPLAADTEGGPATARLTARAERSEFHGDGRQIVTVDGELDTGERLIANTADRTRYPLAGEARPHKKAFVADDVADIDALREEVKEALNARREHIAQDLGVAVEAGEPKRIGGTGEGSEIRATGTITTDDGREAGVTWRNIHDFGHTTSLDADDREAFTDAEIDALAALARNESPISRRMRM